MIKKSYLVVIPSFNYGGAEKVLINFANELSKYKEVTILALNKNGGLKKTIDKKVKLKIFNKYNSIKKLYKLYQYLRINKFDYVITSILHLNVIFCCFKIFLFRNKTELIIRPSNILISNSINPIGKIYFLFYKYLSFIVYRFADKIISIDDSIKKLLLKQYKIKDTKIIKLNNAILDKNIIKKKYKKKLKFKKKFILAVGSLTKQKGFECLINIFNSFNVKKEFILVIIGKGYLENKLKKIALRTSPNNIKFIKETSNPYKYFKQCNLFVLSSKYEGQPNALIEAAYLSKRILSLCSNSSVKKILRLRNNYIISKTNNKKENLSYINSILNSNRRMTTNVYKNYSISLNTLKLINHVEK